MWLPLRTKPSGLYRHRRGLGLYKVGYRERNLHIWTPNLPSKPRRVPSGHGWESSILYLHSPSVRPMSNRPDARRPLSPGLLHSAHLPFFWRETKKMPARLLVFKQVTSWSFTPCTNYPTCLTSCAELYLRHSFLLMSFSFLLFFFFIRNGFVMFFVFLERLFLFFC